MAKKLIIISNTYPFGLGESFLENELTFFSEFDEVIIFPTFTSKFNTKRKVEGSNVSVVRPKTKFSDGNAISRVFYFFLSLFTKNVKDEMLYLIDRKKFTITNISHLLSFTSKGDYFYRFIKDWIEDNCENDEIYLYSYWLYYQSYVACRIKNELHKELLNKNCILCKTFSRAHGFDLYEERNKGNYIPYRDKILSTLDAVYCISENGKKYIDDKYKYVDKGEVKVSKLGTKDYGNQEYNYEEKNNILRVVSCSRVERIKQLDKLIDGLAEIKNIRLEWIHIGDGNEFEYIKKYADEKLKSKSNIKYSFLGGISNKKIMDLYAQREIDIFINVSEDEGVPVSIMEAFSFGIPVIAPDIGGIPEIVFNEHNGILLNESFDSNEIVVAINNIYKMTDSDYELLRRNARQTWEKLYNSKSNYTKFVKEIQV